MIANRLPLLLKNRGLSIRELSRRTGITYTTIRAAYHGDRRSVQIDVLDSICRVLDIQPADIYKYYPDESAALAAAAKLESTPQLTDSLMDIDSKNGKQLSTAESEHSKNWHVW